MWRWVIAVTWKQTLMERYATDLTLSFGFCFYFIYLFLFFLCGPPIVGSHLFDHHLWSVYLIFRQKSNEREWEKERKRGERERKMSLSLSLSPLPPKKEFSLYHKLWDSLDKREKIDKSDTKQLWTKKLIYFPIIKNCRKCMQSFLDPRLRKFLLKTFQIRVNTLTNGLDPRA